MKGQYVKPIKHLNDGVDRTKLREILKNRGETQSSLARTWGKDAAFVSNKLTGRAPFKMSDIQFLKVHLNLSDAVASEIFFGKSE